MVYGVTERPSAHRLYMEFVRDNPDWIALGLAAVNLWGSGIDGVRVPLQQVVAMAIREAYSRGLEGLPPRDIPYVPQVIKRPRPPQNEPFKPPIFGRRRRPDPPQEEVKPVIVFVARRRPPPPPERYTPPVLRRRRV